MGKAGMMVSPPRSPLPVNFDQPGAAFVFLRDGIKFPPIEKEWEKKGHSFQEATVHKGNVGVMAGSGYIGLDQDVPEAFEGLELPSTTTWETRPGRLGMWLKCNDRTPEVLAKYDKKADLAQFKLFKNGQPVGEVKLERTYQVIPPSWKEVEGQRVDYKMLREIPPAEISLAWLLSELQRLGIKFSSKLDKNASKLESVVKEARQKKAETDEHRTRRYAEAALNSEVRTLANVPEGARNDQLNRSAFALGQLVAAGVLSESEVIRDLSRAASYTGLNPEEIERTIRSGLDSGTRHPREIPEKSEASPTIRKVSIEDQSGTVGLAEDGTVKQVMIGKDEVKSLKWVSDCALYIETETSANNATEFTFKGEGAKDHREISFTLSVDATLPDRFKVALRNAFGAVNQVGKLDFEMVQRLTRNCRKIRRIEVPSWNGSIPMIPGVSLASDTEFRLSPMTPAKVSDGDLQVAKDLLRTLLKTHPFTSILVTAIMGAPAVARWRPDDRIAVAMWAGTGTQKTTVAKACMSIYGSEYQSDRYLLKHGRGGSTVVAALEIMARAGILPQILDDVKAVDPKDHQNYVSVVHAVIEGSDKQRGKKDGGLREAQIFRSTPIITGEVRPEEASTDARVCNLSWSKPNLALLNEIESRAGEMPIIGYHWLRFLAETDLNLNDGFNAARSKKELEFSRAGFTTNPGRLATIYTVLMAAWKLLCESPLGEVFKEATEDFTRSLTRAIQEQGSIVNSDTEASKFLAGVNELLASQPLLFQAASTDGSYSKIIGKRTDEGLFLLPNETLAELDKLKVFTQKPTVDSMGKALADAGKLILGKDGHHRQILRRVNGVVARGWMVTDSALCNHVVVTDNQHREGGVTTVTTETTENSSGNFSEKINDHKDTNECKRESNESGGYGGYSGYSTVVDGGFGVTTSSPPDNDVVTSRVKCKTVEDVVNCLDHSLTEIQNPVLADWLHKQGLPYIPVTFLLKDRGWKQDDVTRTMRKAAVSEA